MTIQEYKEKIVHTIEQMEMEHNIDLEMFNFSYRYMKVFREL